MNKRILSMIVVVVLLAAMFSFATTAYAYYTVYSHCSNGSPLNVRSGPGKDYPVIDRIPYGDILYVIGETAPGWLQLNDVGYVQASLTCTYYPGPYTPTPKPAPAPSQPSIEKVLSTAKTVDPYFVTLKATPRSNGVANVRWAPSKKSKLLKAYPSGSQVKVIAELDKWYQVQDPVTGETGFVNTAYVQR